VDLDLTTWFGLFAPPATPDQIVAQLNAAIEEALKDPGVIEKYRAIGLQPSGGSSKEFASFLDKDRARWKQVIEEEKLSSE
jgi:tripartite-type tricarboxylate transporter receptor subunit TctC